MWVMLLHAFVGLLLLFSGVFSVLLVREFSSTIHKRMLLLSVLKADATNLRSNKKALIIAYYISTTAWTMLLGGMYIWILTTT